MFEEEIILINDVRNYSKWMSEPKVLGSRVLRVEIFFAIKTNTAFRDAIQGQICFFQKQKIRVDVKRTVEEHTASLGCIVRYIVGRANMGWCEEAMKKLRTMKMGEVELKKDAVWEGDGNQWCIEVHGVWAENDKVDLAMR